MDLILGLSILEYLSNINRYELFGRLTVKVKAGLTWKLYCHAGSLIWIDGGPHPHRSLHRELKQIAPKLDWSSAAVTEFRGSECYLYRTLLALQQAGEMEAKQLQRAIAGKVAADLFDIRQQESLGQISYGWESRSDAALRAMGLEPSLQADGKAEIGNLVESQWSVWQERGYGAWSPNLAPFLKQREELRQAVAGQTFRNLVHLLDGNNTLRDLAAIAKRDLLQVMNSLAKHVRKGYIELLEVRDVPCHSSPPDGETVAKPVAKPLPKPIEDRQLVVCIDGDEGVCQEVQQALTGVGYHCIGVKNPLNALPVLTERVPDLIFLDLAMSGVGGRELCARIRKIPKLKTVPIVALTSTQGVFDEIRTKVLGVSECIAKPVDCRAVVAIAARIVSEKQASEPTAAMTSLQTLPF